jgi:tetratricopeptide (TPR) repeat protein
MLILLAFLLEATGASSANEMSWERTFADAARAYDANRLPEAIAGWKALVAEGQAQPEVLFNLGNAYYRNGNMGEAIRSYRHAQMLAPRDPDIRANLGFAAQTAGITLPARSPLAALMLDVSRSEWLVLGSACFWLLFLALAGWILWPRIRFLSRPASAVLAALLAIASVGLWLHRDLQTSPECVVMVGGQKVLSGPLESATPILAVPEGAIVRNLDRRGPWIQIETDSARGWLPAAAVAPVR